MVALKNIQEQPFHTRTGGHQHQLVLSRLVHLADRPFLIRVEQGASERETVEAWLVEGIFDHVSRTLSIRRKYCASSAAIPRCIDTFQVL